MGYLQIKRGAQTALLFVSDFYSDLYRVGVQGVDNVANDAFLFQFNYNR